MRACYNTGKWKNILILMTLWCPVSSRFTQLILCKSGKETRRLQLSAAQSQSLCRRPQVAGQEKKETPRSLAWSLSARNTMPCLGQVLTLFRTESVKLYTLFGTAKPKNHTLSSGTSPHIPNKGVPLPPPLPGWRVMAIIWQFSEKQTDGQIPETSSRTILHSFALPCFNSFVQVH